MPENNKLELARQIIERTGHSLFLTGRAGTGKTTFLRNLRASTRKRMIVTAPTGIAAINAGGVTLHSFFQLDFGPFVPGSQRPNHRSFSFSREKIKIIRGLDLLVIDEMSMVRSDMLDAVDAVLRRYRDRSLPFGGVQLLMIGDLLQLPPVVIESEKAILQANYRSPYFFDCHALAEIDYVTLELDRVYRQTDSNFLELLNAVRDNRADADVIQALNARCRPGFNPGDSEGYVRLTTHNRFADEINRNRMAALPGESQIFRAGVKGNFPESSYPADPQLQLKVGAQVMFIKNDTGSERRFYNGMLGTVTGMDENGVEVTPADGGYPIDVEQVSWENVKYEADTETKEIRESVEGVFTQLPLKPAWAITIHKSQGLTFDHAIIDASLSFTHGQTYVALSRCRTLEGLVLDRPLSPGSIITDPTVTGFILNHAVEDIDDQTINSMSHRYGLKLASEMFNLRPIFSAAEGLVRLYQENFMRLFPTQVYQYANSVSEMRDNLISVGDRFARQIEKIDAEAGGVDDNPKLTQRIKDASKYFLTQLDLLIELTAALPDEHDNSSVNKKLKERRELFSSFATIRRTLLEAFKNRDFNVRDYLEIKAAGAFSQDVKKKKSRKAEVKEQRTSDNLHPKLLDQLLDWRQRQADAFDVNPNTIASKKSLIAISNHLPTSFAELFMMPGVGRLFMKNHGEEILDIVDNFIATESDLVIIPLPQVKGRKLKRLSRFAASEAPEHSDDLSKKNSDEPIRQCENEDKAVDSEKKEEKALKSANPNKKVDNSAEPRKKAGDSARLSYSMFVEGKTISEIAAERGLKESTIATHIGGLIDTSDSVIMERFLPTDLRKGIEGYFDVTPELPSAWQELFEGIRSHCGMDPLFSQVKIMMAMCGRELSKPKADSDTTTPQAGEPIPAYGVHAGLNDNPDFLN